MVESIRLCLVVACLVPASAQAASSEYCKPFPFRGAVKSIEIEEPKIDQKTGAIVHVPKNVDIAVSRDKRTVTRISYQSDFPLPGRLQRWPTTIFEYDASGRVTRETLQLDGRTEFTVTECHYDGQGRPTYMTMRSKNPEFDNRKITFAYGHGWETERFQTRVANNLTTRTLDSQGRVVKEVEVDELRGYVRAQYEFAYAGSQTTRCWQDPGNGRQCSTSVQDQHGNVVSYTGPGIAIKKNTTYEYDAAGNWTSERADAGTISFGPPLTLRRITYW